MIKRQYTYLICAIIISAFFTGCSNYHHVREITNFESARPRSILVIPVVNKSVDVYAPTSVLSTLPKILGEKGYYVFPINTVKVILDHEGFYEAAEVHAQAPESLAAMFGADAILYVTINRWTSQYVLFSTTTIVDFDYRIVNHDGAQLWSASKTLTFTPHNEDTGNELTNLLVASISAALERASPNYLPLTRQANNEVFSSGYSALPPGPYASQHELYYTSLETEIAAQNAAKLEP